MQYKSFIAGTIAGIAVTVSAIQLLGQTDPRTDSTTSNPTAVSAAVGVAGNSEADRQVSVPQDVSAQQNIAEVGSAVEDINDGRTNADNVSIKPAMQTANPLNQIPATDSHRQLLDQYANADPKSTTPSSNRLDLENEPRDHDWSYFMEQSIGQYLANHREIVYFDIAGIECRSTMCEIQSFGVDENAGPRWGLILHDLRNQPWNDFGQTGSSSRTIDGRLIIITHLRRQSGKE